MKKNIFVGLILLLFSTIIIPQAFSLAPYDDFSGNSLLVIHCRAAL